MKSVSGTLKTPKPSFPCLMRKRPNKSGNSDFIVLMSSGSWDNNSWDNNNTGFRTIGSWDNNNTGFGPIVHIIIQNSTKDLFIGQYSTNWYLSSFEVYNESITLCND